MEAVIFCGIQASGKSTFYKQRFFATHMRLSLDQLRTRSRESRFLQACLETGMPFVVDNTNPLPEDRARYTGLARSNGFRTVAYWFDTPLGEALTRNEGREGRERIPSAGIRATSRKFRPPAPQEGFDQIHRVSVRPDGTSVVELTWPTGDVAASS